MAFDAHFTLYRAASWRRTVTVLNWISKEIEWRRPSSILNGHWWSIMVRSRSFDSSSPHSVFEIWAATLALHRPRPRWIWSACHWKIQQMPRCPSKIHLGQQCNGKGDLPPRLKAIESVCTVDFWISRVSREIVGLYENRGTRSPDSSCILPQDANSRKHFYFGFLGLPILDCWWQGFHLFVYFVLNPKNVSWVDTRIIRRSSWCWWYHYDDHDEDDQW